MSSSDKQTNKQTNKKTKQKLIEIAENDIFKNTYGGILVETEVNQ